MIKRHLWILVFRSVVEICQGACLGFFYCFVPSEAGVHQRGGSLLFRDQPVLKMSQRLWNSLACGHQKGSLGCLSLRRQVFMAPCLLPSDPALLVFTFSTWLFACFVLGLFTGLLVNHNTLERLHVLAQGFSSQAVHQNQSRPS